MCSKAVGNNRRCHDDHARVAALIALVVNELRVAVDPLLDFTLLRNSIVLSASFVG